MIDKHNPESSFCQKCKGFWSFFVPIVQKLPSDCVQKSQDARVHRKSRFFKGFSKRNLSKEFANAILNPVFVKSVRFWAFFVAIVQNVPSDCSQNLRDSRIHRKDRFSKGFQKQFKQRICKHNPESSFC